MDVRAWLADLTQDVRFALRQIVKSPLFSVVVVVTLAVGIGANTAVFTVVNGVILRPLPYPEPQELVRVWTRFLPESGYEGEDFPPSAQEVMAYQEATEVLDDVTFYWFQNLTVTGEDAEPLRLRAVATTADLPRVLGTEPFMGRWFTSQEDEPDQPFVAVLGYDFWVSRYGAAADIVGRTMVLNARTVEIIGVMPQGFSFPGPGTQLYRPGGISDADPGGWGSHGPNGVGRLAAGRTLDQAQAELDALVERWRGQYGHPQQGHSIYLVPLADATVQAVSGTLWMLMGAVVLVLLIAAANVANLLLARGEARAREVALRMALGAGGGRIFRQFLTESLILAGLGAALGLALAPVVVAGALRLNPEDLPRSEGIALDPTVLAFTALVAVSAAVVFGVVPALQGIRGSGAGTWGDGRVAGSQRGRYLRRGLIAAEVALSVVVVLGAGLLTRSFMQTLRVDAGMEVEGRVLFSLALPSGAYPTDDEVRSAVVRLVEGVEAIPGVESASFSSMIPLSGSRYIPDFRIQGRPRPGPGERMLSAVTNVVTPGFTETLGLEVVRGRSFAGTDRDGSELVALVSEEAVRVFWPGEDPLGDHIGFSYASDTIPWARVVGVIQNVRQDDLQSESRPMIYLAHGQETGFWADVERNGFLVARTAVEPLSVVPALRQALAALDPNLPMPEVTTLRDVVRRSVARPRFASVLLAGFGAIALLLALVGVYGVVSYSVARRTREIGIRMALGAEEGSVVRLMVREGALPALVGVMTGLVVAWLSSSRLEGMLFQVSSTDPLTFLTLPLALGAIAVLASWVPSRRATRVAPTEALREE